MRKFITRIEPAHERIHELERQLGLPPSDLSELINIDTAAEEIDRLEYRLSGGATAKAAAQLARASQVKVALSAKPAVFHGFKNDSGMAKLAAAIQKTNH